MKVLAYRAFSAYKLAKLTGKDRDDKLCAKLENELLTALQEAAGLCNGRLPVPTPETQEGNAEFAAWVATLDDRF